MVEVSLYSILREKDGFVYLEVPDCIINAFLEMIPNKTLVAPKHVVKEKYVGPHISVISQEEFVKIKNRKNRNKIKEIGETFKYTIDKLYKTKPKNWDDVKEVFFISVKSEELENFRKKYGLRKKMNGHDFHITVGVIKI